MVGYNVTHSQNLTANQAQTWQQLRLNIWFIKKTKTKKSLESRVARAPARHAEEQPAAYMRSASLGCFLYS